MRDSEEEYSDLFQHSTVLMLEHLYIDIYINDNAKSQKGNEET